MTIVIRYFRPSLPADHCFYSVPSRVIRTVLFAVTGSNKSNTSAVADPHATIDLSSRNSIKTEPSFRTSVPGRSSYDLSTPSSVAAAIGRFSNEPLNLTNKIVHAAVAMTSHPSNDVDSWMGDRSEQPCIVVQPPPAHCNYGSRSEYLTLDHGGQAPGGVNFPNPGRVPSPSDAFRSTNQTSTQNSAYPHETVGI